MTAIVSAYWAEEKQHADKFASKIVDKEAFYLELRASLMKILLAKFSSNDYPINQTYIINPIKAVFTQLI